MFAFPPCEEICGRTNVEVMRAKTRHRLRFVLHGVTPFASPPNRSASRSGRQAEKPRTDALEWREESCRCSAWFHHGLLEWLSAVFISQDERLHVQLELRCCRISPIVTLCMTTSSSLRKAATRKDQITLGRSTKAVGKLGVVQRTDNSHFHRAEQQYTQCHRHVVAYSHARIIEKRRRHTCNCIHCRVHYLLISVMLRCQDRCFLPIADA